MAGREQVYADIEQVARVDDRPLLNAEGMEQIAGLVQAHHDHDEVASQGAEEISALSAQIAELTKRKDDLERARNGAVSRQHRLRHDFSDRLSGVLKNARTDVNPLYAAALLAPGLEQGSLWYPDTLAKADQLGRDLVSLNETLIASTAPAPVAALHFRRNPGQDDFSDVHIDYGFTSPGKGLTAHVVREQTGQCSCGAPHFENKPFVAIPVITPSLAAVKMGGWRYASSTGKEVSFNAEGERRESITSRSIPTANVPSIPLPTGNLHQTGYTLALYDKDEDTIELQGPRNFIERSPTLCAIGERAVKAALIEMLTHAAEAQQPQLSEDMALFVASALGVIIGKQDFRSTVSNLS